MIEVYTVKVNIQRGGNITPHVLTMSADARDVIPYKVKEWLRATQICRGYHIKDYKILHKERPKEERLL